MAQKAIEDRPRVKTAAAGTAPVPAAEQELDSLLSVANSLLKDWKFAPRTDSKKVATLRSIRYSS